MKVGDLQDYRIIKLRWFLAIMASYIGAAFLLPRLTAQTRWLIPCVMLLAAIKWFAGAGIGVYYGIPAIRTSRLPAPGSWAFKQWKVYEGRSARRLGWGMVIMAVMLLISGIVYTALAVVSSGGWFDPLGEAGGGSPIYRNVDRILFDRDIDSHSC